MNGDKCLIEFLAVGDNGFCDSYSFKTFNEFYNAYWYRRNTLPSENAKIAYFKLSDIKMRFKTFKEIVAMLDIDRFESETAVS